MRTVTNPLGWSQYWTHQKKPYHAYAVQWTGNNFAEVQALFPGVMDFIHLENAPVIMVRFRPGGISTIRPGDWSVRGENGEVKIYTDEIFRIKYEAL